MLRDVDQLTARTFDVLVVGGGIYGLTIAYDAAQRGLSAALIEPFGGATNRVDVHDTASRRRCGRSHQAASTSISWVSATKARTRIN